MNFLTSMENEDKKNPIRHQLTWLMVLFFSLFHTKEFIISSFLSCRSFIHTHIFHCIDWNQQKARVRVCVCVCIVTLFRYILFSLLGDVFFWHGFEDYSVNIIFNVHQQLRYVSTRDDLSTKYFCIFFLLHPRRRRFVLYIKLEERMIRKTILTLGIGRTCVSYTYSFLFFLFSCKNVY